MKTIRNSIGWEDEFGMQVAYDKEHAFFNNCRPDKLKLPILKEMIDNRGSKSQEVRK